MADFIEILLDNISSFLDYASMLFTVIADGLAFDGSMSGIIPLVVPSVLVPCAFTFVFFAIVYNIIRSVF